MRLHSLEVTAFGPFAGTERVDFDRLTQAGLFLLHGPTGAGKSSLLDAICFALYGRVPGARAGSRLRSDHAAGSVAPQVRCEFTVAGRRLEVTRSPEWQRHKRRGAGTVTERTHVTLREFKDGAWVSLSHRVDEVAERLHELIGLGADQFTKLVLLPQGDFAAFLRASADDRRTLLQKLFGTERFLAVEDWLTTRRRELDRELEQDAAITASLFARARQALESMTPDDLHSAATPDELGLDLRDAAEVTALVQEWAQETLDGRAAAKERSGAAEQAFERARRIHDQAAEQARLRGLRAELTIEEAVLTAQEPDSRRWEASLTAARAGVVLTPLLERLPPLAAARAAAVQAVTDALRAVPSAEHTGVGHDDAGDLHRRVQQLRDELASLRELVAAETELTALDGQHGRCRSDLVMAQSQYVRADQELATLGSWQSGVMADLGSAVALATALPERRQAATRAAEVARAVLADEQLAGQQQRLAQQVHEAIDRHHAAVAATLDLRERRLAGMAAELASGLADEQPCPVCGGTEHPAPARPGAQAVTQAAERRVEQAQARAEQQRQEAQAKLAEVERQRAAAQAISDGLSAAQAAELLAAAQAQSQASAAAAGRQAQLQQELEALRGQLEQARQRREQAATQAEQARIELAAIGSRIQTLQAPVIAARGDDENIAARQARLTALAGALEHWASARDDQAAATARLAEQQELAASAASAAGFATLDQASKAWLTPEEQHALAERLETYRAACARVQARLADPALQEAAERGAGAPADPGAAPDQAAELKRIIRERDQAREVAQQAAAEHTLAVQAAHALAALTVRLRDHARGGGPLRQRFAVLDGVARTAAGGGDNALRMRLSSYVLAARLEQVAEAASVRLAGMSGGRYTLVHTDGPARGGARSGLGLAVVDGWSGTQRDPSSLSGGETFCTALALALGLADVVQAEAGGAVIETLLVDEGFGSLDAETLDEVMDVLDELRTGGRCVGLVSHVADLRDRIPARLEVVKTRTGSHLVA